MTKLQLLEQEIEQTRAEYLALLNAIPESDYDLPTENPAWTVGDILYHITLGPRALTFEIWMIIYLRGLFQFALDHFPSNLFNSANAKLTQQGKRFTRAKLMHMYESAHTALLRRLHKTRAEDLGKSVIYPAALEAILAGETSVEKLFHYVKDHFEAHKNSIRREAA